MKLGKYCILCTIQKNLPKQSITNWSTLFKNGINLYEHRKYEPHRFRLLLVDKLNLKNPNENIALANLKKH